MTLGTLPREKLAEKGRGRYRRARLSPFDIPLNS